MLMPGRSYSSTAYKYGFNGKEKDDEVKGAGNSVDFGARIYDSRIGRFLSVDAASQPSWSKYKSFFDNPIIYSDPSGNTEFFFNNKWIGSDKNKNGMIAVVTSGTLANTIKASMKSNGEYTQLGALGNGQKFNGGFSIHTDVLQKSLDVLDDAINEPSLIEHVSVMKKSQNKFVEAYSGVGPVYQSGQPVASASTPTGGDVLIHSHIVSSWFEPVAPGTSLPQGMPSSYQGVASFDASDLTPADNTTFNAFPVNIVVGKEGRAESVWENNMITNQPQQVIKDTRDYVINIFDSNSNKTGTIKKDDAVRMISRAKKEESK